MQVSAIGSSPNSHIAGLSANRAENIIKYRFENGPFKSRDDLKKVKMVGEKTFQQCAGFIRIEPLTANLSSESYNKLDSTWVHPESYEIAQKLIRKVGFSPREIGSERFVQKVNDHLRKNETRMNALAEEHGVPVERVINDHNDHKTSED